MILVIVVYVKILNTVINNSILDTEFVLSCGLNEALEIIAHVRDLEDICGDCGKCFRCLR